MRVLGISAYYHDSAAALVEDGRIVAAAQEERFSRKKFDASFPARAIRSVLSACGVELRDVDRVVFYEKPFLKFDRLLETYLALAPRGFRSFGMAMPLWARERLFQKRRLCRELAAIDARFPSEDRLLFAEHHLSHAASAFFPSPFERAAVVTLDGVGEWATGSIGIGDGRSLRILDELRFPHSLGLLYAAFTQYIGFEVNADEYKVMGLAPYGEPRFEGLILERLVDLKEDGSFRLDLDFFDFCAGLSMTGRRFHDLFGGPPRSPFEPIERIHMDLAASVQRVTEEVVLRIARTAAARTGMKDLCLAGGVALNCVANGRLLREGPFDRLWIQPAAGDAGGALGAALYATHALLDEPRSLTGGDAMQGAFLGDSFSEDEIQRTLSARGVSFALHDEEDLLRHTVDALIDGQAVGWFQGRMEFGPRALGARSILADPRRPEMQSVLNLKVKFRESFRPFAPAVLREEVSRWFDLDRESPYMLLVSKVADPHRRPLTGEEASIVGFDRQRVVRSTIPAVTHVDDTARIQTVDPATNPLFHRLLRAFFARTGCPVLVNTSFNVRDEPIVCTPGDALSCFQKTEIDVLVIGRAIVRKR
ncbi:MAG: carbamoyltransferase [Deltaproteobacteria bacterium]|nr:carbamoyltransferase [Deltaproteobacteria bacterium]